MFRKLTWPLVGVCLLAIAIGLVAIFLQYPGRFAAGAGLYLGLAALYGGLFFWVDAKESSAHPENATSFAVLWLAALVGAGLTMAFVRPFETNWAYWTGGVAVAAGALLFGICAQLLGVAMDALDAGDDYSYY